MTRFLRSRRGGAAAEFGLTFPLLMMTFGAVLELSNYVSKYHLVGRAARDAARVGSVTLEGTDAAGTEIIANAEEHAADVLEAVGYEAADYEVTAVWEEDPTSGWMMVTVSIDVDYDPITTLFTAPGLESLTSEFTMLTQQQLTSS